MCRVLGYFVDILCALVYRQKLNYVREEYKPARCCSFATVTFPMTLKLEADLDILKMRPYTENKAASLRHSKLRAWIVEIRSVIVIDIPIKP